MADDTPCYAAYCPACSGMVAVAVAPVDIPVVMRDALKSRREWERAGLRIAVVTVAAIHNGALQGHADGCPNDIRARKRAQLALKFASATALTPGASAVGPKA